MPAAPARPVRLRLAAAAAAAATVLTALPTVLTGAASAAGSGLTLTNLDGGPMSDRLVTYRIGSPKTDPPNLVHDESSVKVTNSGSSSTTLTKATLSGPWVLAAGPSLPTTLAPGASATFTVRFTAGHGVVRTGSLVIASSAGSKAVQLAGIWQRYSEMNTEPTLAQVVQVFGYQTSIPSDVDQDGAVKAQGDEVLSPYWKRLDASQPVQVLQLAALHTHPNTATLYTYAKGSSSTTSLVKMNGDSAQSLLPWASGSTTKIAGTTYTPTATTFGFKVDGEWSDPTKNDQSKDRSNGCTAAQCGNHVRFWPVKDRAGNVVKGQYLLAMDYSGINYDYQDNVYRISNITPAG